MSLPGLPRAASTQISVFSPHAQRAIDKALKILEDANISVVGCLAERVGDLDKPGTEDGLAMKIRVHLDAKEERDAPVLINHMMSQLVHHMLGLHARFVRDGLVPPPNDTWGFRG